MQHSLQAPVHSAFGLFGLHLSATPVFTPAQKTCTKRGNKPKFSSTELNKTDMNTILKSKNVKKHQTGDKKSFKTVVY